MRIVRIESTPNPNAVKCILDSSICESPRSYFRKEDAHDDALASELFAIDGVTNVLILRDWITVNKAPDASWKKIQSALRRLIREQA